MRNESIPAIDIDLVTQRLNAALSVLRGSDMHIERARAIVDTASTLIDTLKVEAQQNSMKKEKEQ